MSKIATNFAAYFNEASSEEEEFDLKEMPQQTMIDSKVVPYLTKDSQCSEKLFEQFIIIEPNLGNKQFEISYIYPNDN